MTIAVHWESCCSILETRILRVLTSCVCVIVVKKGDRVAQLVLERICMAPIVEVESLDETSRGSGGLKRFVLTDVFVEGKLPSFVDRDG